jgi:hypothetical protein
MNVRVCGLLLFACVIAGCRNEPGVATDTAKVSVDNKARKRKYDAAETYTNLRNQVFQSKTDGSPNSSPVLAVLMETGYPEAVATLAATSDGDASIYFSNGGGFIGGGEHADVQEVSRSFVGSAKNFVSKASLTDSFPLPDEGNVRFYLITKTGTYTVEALEDDLGNDRHPFSSLFHEGHRLIAAIRSHDRE